MSIVGNGGGVSSSTIRAEVYPTATQVVEKTLATSGGDFTTIQQLFDWIDAQVGGQTATLWVYVQPGTYDIPNFGANEGSYLSLGQVFGEIGFYGTNKTTCIFRQTNNADWTDAPVFNVVGSSIVFDTMTLNATGTSNGVVNLTNAYCAMNNVNVTGFTKLASVQAGSTLQLTTVSATAPAGGISNTFVSVTKGGVVYMSGSTLDGGTNGTGSWGLECAQYGQAFIEGSNTIRNFGTGIYVTNAGIATLASTPTFSGNTANYNVTINVVSSTGAVVRTTAFSAHKLFASLDVNGQSIVSLSNGDITLAPNGTGRVRFGTHSALAAETVTGYITIKDAGGTSRKIAVVS